MYAAVKVVLDKNKNTQSVEDINIRKRVLEAAKLITKGKNVAEIAEELNSSFYTIYRDLTVRLPKIKDIDPNIMRTVKQLMSQNKELNLELGRMMPVDESKRDEKGRFI